MDTEIRDAMFLRRVGWEFGKLNTVTCCMGIFSNIGNYNYLVSSLELNENMPSNLLLMTRRQGLTAQRYERRQNQVEMTRAET